ncbi:hypothetical protein APHAL10511_007969 [Amanita phalloides]|nr:hypothetical protein APHAL10511_007969 [Amanita phalloides]
MAKFYPSENERKVVGLRRLKFSVAMFSCRLDTPNVKMKFRILQRYPDEQDNHYLYIAEILDKKLILVKFTKRYSIELHALCASRGRAPRILGFERIAGGWSVIAMEYIHPAVHPSESTDLTRLCDQWADLRELVRSFHGEGWVHGDLRRPNMICNGETVMLLDWGGKIGEARYPTALLCDELRNGRHNTDAKITKDDDLRVLENAIQDLKN